jgi:2-dehydropantoate 2-reductase
MKHAILGPGGVGGLIGASLAHAGESVTMVMRPGSANPGQLHLESPFGNFFAHVDWTSSVPSADVVWITVKATELEAALTSFPNTNSVQAIVPLLNGVDHVEQLRARYGHEKVIPATIAVEAERVAPGRIVHRSPFARLNMHASGRTVLEKIIQQLQLIGFTCQFVDNEATLIWSKLVFLCPLALASTASAKTIGEMAADQAWSNRVEACLREVASVARQEGAEVNPDAVLSFIRSLPGHMRSSMQKDVEQGRAPELDAIGGAVLRHAERHGIEVSVTCELVDAVTRRISRQQSGVNRAPDS